MSLIAGIDLSTRELHAALIPLDWSHDAIYRSAPIACGRRKGDAPVDMRHVKMAVRDLLREANDFGHRPIGFYSDVVCAVVEHPAGDHAGHALLPVYGAIAASIPGHITYAAYRPAEWRRLLAVQTYGHDPNLPVPRHQLTKDHLRLILERSWTGPQPPGEHYADALGLALAFRNANEAAAA